MRSNVLVEPGETTTGIDFLLTLIPTTGFLYGTVTIEGNMADIMQVTITADSTSVTPDNQGDYLMELPVGSYQVTAIHPFTLSDTATVLIEPGSSTQQDFFLPMLRRDMVITCHDQNGYVLNGAFIEVTGPEDNYSGTIENDSIVFAQVPYGNYYGEGVYESYIGLSDTLIDGNNNKLDFTIIISSAQSQLFNTLMISPNPVNYNQSINLGSDKILTGRLVVYDMYGRTYGDININSDNIHNLPVSLVFNDKLVNEGMYIFQLTTADNIYATKVLIHH
jgi:hypothetical protein